MERVRSVRGEKGARSEKVKQMSYLDEIQTHTFISVKLASPPHHTNFNIVPLTNGTSSVFDIADSIFIVIVHT